jgi:hypothetical protein
MHPGKPVVLALLACVSSLSARASLVDSDPVTYQGYSNTTETPLTYGAPVAYTAGSTAVAIPGTSVGQTGGQATLSSSGDVFTITDVTAFSPPACQPGHNCLQGGLITIGGQTVTGVMFISSSIANITASDVGAAGGGAFVQLEGLNVTPGETLVFSVAATPVPVPSSLLLGLSGIAGLGLFRTRRSATVSH